MTCARNEIQLDRDACVTEMHIEEVGLMWRNHDIIEAVKDEKGWIVRADIAKRAGLHHLMRVHWLNVEALGCGEGVIWWEQVPTRLSV